ncbi:MAG: hypothetical protein LBR29_00195 [Methylobacteriaceae bacterium]|nr:hypothetical protein [Methylobacteriaceae bacterium]
MKEFREARPPAMEQSVENKADQAFLEHIRRPLAPLDALPNPYVSLESLKSAVEKDFEQNKALVLQRYPDLTGRQALVFYLQARVHGSFSTYFVRGCMPADVTQQLYSAIGNCSDYAVRLMLLADLFGIETARVSFFTPSLPGHMLVEAFDPQENTAYLLDPTFNLLLMMRSPPTRGGVLTQLLTMTAQERVRLLSGNTTGFLYQLPFRFYYANPGLGHFSGRSLSVPGIMIDPGALVGMWKKAFGEELE